MGYCVSMDCNITFANESDTIKKQDVIDIINTLDDSFAPEQLMAALKASGKALTVQEAMLSAINEFCANGASWVDAGPYDSFEYAMGEWRYDVSYHRNEVCFEGEKLGDDETLWSCLAPWIIDGSYIECHGEDGAVWRWVFQDGKLRTQTPQWG